MRYFIKKSLHFGVGIILFLGGGIFFAQLFLNELQIPESKIIKVSNETIIAESKKIISLPTPLKMLDVPEVSERGFRGDYGLLNTEEIITATNDFRKNIPSLLMDSRLNRSAEKKVDDMFAQQYFEHTAPNNVNADKLISTSGYDFVLIGENLAMGDFHNSQDLVDAWIASPAHRENILNERYVDIGVSAKRGMFEGREVWIAVQHFGLSANVCPKIDSNLEKTVKNIKKDLENDSARLNILRQKAEQTGLLSDIEFYNTEIQKYNTQTESLKIKISSYNHQVNNFNDCIADYNSNSNSTSF